MTENNTQETTQTYKETKAKYTPESQSILSLFRDPMDNPLATTFAALIVSAFAYQAWAAAQQFGSVGAIAVLGTAAIAYGFGKMAWAVENDFVASELAKQELDPSAENPSVTPVNAD